MLAQSNAIALFLVLNILHEVEKIVSAERCEFFQVSGFQFLSGFSFPSILLDLCFKMIPKTFDRTDLWSSERIEFLVNERDCQIAQPLLRSARIVSAGQVKPKNNLMTRIILVDKRNQMLC